MTATRAMSEPCSFTGETMPMHHVVDEGGVELVAVADGLQHGGGEVQGGRLVQGAVGLALAARGADRVVDVGLGHFPLLRSRCGLPGFWRQLTSTYRQRQVRCEPWHADRIENAANAFRFGVEPTRERSAGCRSR